MTEESKLTYGRNEQAVPSEFHVTAPEHSSAKGYDPLYAAFDSPLMRQLRQEAYPFIMSLVSLGRIRKFTGTALKVEGWSAGGSTGCALL